MEDEVDGHCHNSIILFHALVYASHAYKLPRDLAFGQTTILGRVMELKYTMATVFLFFLLLDLPHFSSGKSLSPTLSVSVI